MNKISTKIDFSQKSLVLITGASRGIGRAIATEISKHINQNSIIILLARSEAGLKETNLQIRDINSALTVLTYISDLSKPNQEDYNEIFREVMNNIDRNNLHYGMIFHNAGHMGILKKAADLNELNDWKQYYDLSLFSTILLNNAFIENFRSFVGQILTVNVTSLLGRTPCQNMGMYGSGKAARDIFFKIVAVEEPKILVLNYSPGPVDTEMFNLAMNTAQSEKVRRSFQVTKNIGAMTPVQTVHRLLSILRDGDYNSGETIEYTDRFELK